jgi:acylphosphatase
VEQVKAVVDGQVQTVGFRPLYSYRHAAKSDNGLFWHADSPAAPLAHG